MRFLPKSEFGYNVLTLMTGTTIAQAIPIAISPILTRIYGPDDFGILALYVSLVIVLSAAAAGRYELAIMLPERDEDADGLVILSIWLAITFSVTTFLIIVFFNQSIANFLGSPEISAWLYMIPISIVLTSFYNSINYWLNRNKRYFFMSRNRVIQSAVAGSSQITIGLGNYSTGGLVLGKVLGQTITTFLIARPFIEQSKHFKINWFDWDNMKRLAYEYKKHPLHLLPAQWMGTAALQLPIFIISSAFGAVATGFYSLAYFMVTMPTGLVANAIGDVYRQKASVIYREHGDFHFLFLRTLSKTVIIAFIPFTLIYFIAPDLFAFVFGEQWRVAGEYSQIIIIASFFQFVFTPVDKGALVVGATAYIFYWHLFRFILIGLVFLASILSDLSIELIIWAITLINVILYCIDGIVEYYLSKGTWVK